MEQVSGSAEATKRDGGLLPTKSSLAAVLSNLFFLALTLGAIYFFAVYLGIDHLRERVAEAGALAPLLIILTKATTIVVVPLGGAPLYPLAGALFGFGKGWLLTLIGDALGASIAFYLSRLFGQKILEYVMGKAHLPMVFQLIEQLSDAGTFIKARLFFGGFPELFAYASGLTRASFALFLSVHMAVGGAASALMVAFGDVILSGNWLVIGGVGLANAALALAGIWWFHGNLKQGG